MERQEPKMTESVDIVGFSEAYAVDFQRLNEEWLNAYFRVEAVDAAVLADPKARIIDSGGEILFARRGSVVIGTVALKRCPDGWFELTKMAVTSMSQGGGVGKRLLDTAIQRFKHRGGPGLYLETHSSLRAAISLYERAGFQHVERPEPSVYERADVYMVFREGEPPRICA